MFNNKVKKFRKNILDCIDLCIIELSERKNGINGESSLEQLEGVILPELKEIIILLDKKELPNRQERYLLSFASAFKVWGWSMQEPTELFIKLIELNNDYKNL